jgi:hypothetical protein
MTPNLAFGANNALESVAALANALNRTLSSSTTLPTTETLSALFSSYQNQRFARAKAHHDLTGFYTRLAAWDGFGMKFASRYLPLITGDKVVVDGFAKLVRGGVKLDYVPLKEKKEGTVKFLDEVEGGEEVGNRMVLKGVCLVGATVLAAWMFLLPRV